MCFKSTIYSLREQPKQGKQQLHPSIKFLLLCGILLKKCLSYMGFQITISLASAVRISKADLAASWQGDQCERR